METFHINIVLGVYDNLNLSGSFHLIVGADERRQKEPAGGRGAAFFCACECISPKL